jgi:poly-gamma-glutamate synthesis protein (capsule biosynthesis protein)
MKETSSSFNLVATGDSMIFQRLSIFGEQKFLAVRKIIKDYEVAFTNFETVIPNGKGFPRYKIDPTAWMTSPKYVLDELKWMGFNLFSLANNHSMDYSEGGLLETLKIFEDSQAAHSGTGRNLSEARAPTYLNTEKARVALISINTSGDDGPAGEARGTIPGRPGLNPLRFTTEYTLKKAEFEQLVEISRKLRLPEPSEGKLNFLGTHFMIGQSAEISTKPYKPDMDGNLRSIDKTKDNADFTFVSIHNHIKRRPGRDYFDDTIEYISEFVEIFSRAAIDTGADAILGTGTHCLNGIEIYKGCPIFYGLGNFISQSYQSNPKPYDWYEARGLHREIDPDENSVVNNMKLDREEEEKRVRRKTTSVIAKIFFEDKKTQHIKLYPIETPRNIVQGGRPMLAEGESAQEILSRLTRLSSEYGTKIIIDGNIGCIDL